MKREDPIDNRGNRAVFFDRDGTINRDRGYTYRIQEFEFLPQAVEGLQKLSQAGYRLFVITNQAGIARGYYTMEDVLCLHEWMAQGLSEQGVQIVRYLVCPHHPDFTGPCACRKPGNALLEEAIEAYQLDRDVCWMIGDRESDQGAAKRSGLRFIGVAESATTEFAAGTIMARDLLTAAQVIVESHS